MGATDEDGPPKVKEKKLSMCNGLNGCCCCFSLRSGSLIAGSFLMTMNALNVVSIVLRDFSLELEGDTCYSGDIKITRQTCFQYFRYGTTAQMVIALMDCLHVITCLLLFIGIFRKSEVMMLPFMSMTVLQVLRMMIVTAASIYLYFLLQQPMVILVNSSIIHIVVVIYLGAVVYSYYPRIMRSMFRDWYLELKKKRNQNMRTALEPMGKIPVAWLDVEGGGLSPEDSFMSQEIANDVEKVKCCKDFLCIVVPMAITAAAWAAVEFFLYQWI